MYVQWHRQKHLARKIFCAAAIAPQACRAAIDHHQPGAEAAQGDRLRVAQGLEGALGIVQREQAGHPQAAGGGGHPYPAGAIARQRVNHPLQRLVVDLDPPFLPGGRMGLRRLDRVDPVRVEPRALPSASKRCWPPTLTIPACPVSATHWLRSSAHCTRTLPLRGSTAPCAVWMRSGDAPPTASAPSASLTTMAPASSRTNRRPPENRRWPRCARPVP